MTEKCRRASVVLLLRAVLAVPVLAAPGCGGEETPSEPTDAFEPRVTEVDVTPGSVELAAVGDTQTFEAIARDQRGNEMSRVSFEWSSTDTAVATVDSTGIVRAASADRTLPTRYYAAGVWDSRNQRVLLHGGSDWSVYGGLWSYDPRSGAWTRLGDGPHRKAHQAVWDSAGGRLIFFGGNDGSAGHSIRADIRIWDASSGQWSRANADGPTPREVVQSSAVYAPGREEMFVFGGMYRHKTDVTNQLFVYHVDENRWEELAPSGTQPAPRKGQSMVWDAAEGRLLMYGGWNSSDPRFDGLWEYDVEENRWRESPAAGSGPMARFDPADEWTELPSSGPGTRQLHELVWLDGEGTALLVGGYGGERGAYRGSVWRWDTSEESWSRVR